MKLLLRRSLLLRFSLLVALCLWSISARSQTDCTAPVAIQWVDLYNVTVNADNSLSATNGGAASENMLEAGQDGWIEFTIGNMGKYSAIGLSYTNLNAGNNSIDYSIEALASGSVVLLEAGVSKGQFNGILTTDVFKVERVGTNIRYLKNGTLLRTVAVDASKRMLLDVGVMNGAVPPIRASFCVPVKAKATLAASSCGGSDGSITLNTYGGTPPYSYLWSDGVITANRSGLSTGSYSVTVSDAAGGSILYSYQLGQKVQWVDLVSVTVNADNSLSSTSGGAASENMLEAGQDGWIEFTIGNMGKYSAIGLSYANINSNNNSIDYAIYTLGSGLINWMETGVSKGGFTGALPSDVYRIERIGNTIRYLRNGILQRSVVTDPTKRLLVDAAVMNGSIPPIRTSFCVPVKATASIVASSCGSNDGSINLNTFGGTPPYSYLWNDGVTTANRTGLAIGSYSVTVSDATGGSVHYSYQLGQKIQWVDAYGVIINANNSLTITGTIWQSGAASENALEAGQDGWIEWVANANTHSHAIGLSFSNPNPNNASINYFFGYNGNAKTYNIGELGTTAVLNVPVATGDLFRIQRLGGTIRYLKNGAVLRSIATDVNKRLLVDVSMGVGTSPVIYTSFCVPVKAAASLVAASCGESDGSITLNTFGGTPPYSYLWNDGVTTANRTGLAVGSYSVTVSDAAGGSVHYSYQLGQKVQWTDIVGVKVNEENSLSLIGTIWQSGAASQNALEAGQDGWMEWTANAGADSYAIGLSFFNLNTANNNIDYALSYNGNTKTHNLNERSTIVIQNIPVTLGDVFRIERLGNSIRYLKNGVVLRTVATDISKRLMMDVSMGSGKTPVFHTSFCVPVKATAVIVAASCGDSDGSITLNTFGGTPPYSYVWNDGATTANRSGLSAGSYSVTVSDAASGSIQYSYQLGQKVQWTDLYNVTANANNTLTKSSGVGSGWSNAGAASQNALEANQDGWIEWTGLPNGMIGFSFINTDVNSNSIDYAINTPAAGQVNLVEKGTGVSSIVGVVSTDVFRIERVGSNIRYLKNGVVMRMVATDASKRLLVDVCIYTAGSTLQTIRTSFCVPVKATAALVAASCGDNDGSITLNTFGGTMPYSYVWGDGATTANRSELSAGTYSVTVSDATGGSIQYSYNLGSRPVWKDVVGVAIDADNGLSRPSGSGWNTGAASVNFIEANQNGWVEWSSPATGSKYVVGLSFTNPDVGFGSIAYGIYHDGDGNIYCLESNATQTNLTGDKATNLFRIERIGTSLRYWKNGAIVRTITVDATKRMLVDVSLNTGQVPTLHVSFCNSYVWNGSVSSSWNNPVNWTPNGVPGTGDNITISTKPNHPLLDTDRNIGGLTFSSGNLNLGGYNLRTTGIVSVSPGAVVSNGKLISQGSSITIGTPYNPTTCSAAIEITSNTTQISNTVFNDAFTLNVTNPAGMQIFGGNTYNGNTTITNSGGNVTLNGGYYKDVFNGPLTINQNGSGYIYPCFPKNGADFNNNVTINMSSGQVRFNHGSGGTGIARLAEGKTLTVNASGGGLYLMNFVQLGTTPQMIHTQADALVIFSGNCSFDGDVSLKTSGQLGVHSSVFNGAVRLENAGAYVSDNSNNTFYGPVTLLNSGSSFLRTSYNKFNADLTITNSGSSASQVQFANSGNSSELNGNVVVNSTSGKGIIIGNTTNKAVLANGKTLSVGSQGFQAGELAINGLTQLGSQFQNLELSGSATLRILNSTFNGEVDFKAPQLYLDGATYNNTASFTKTGTGANNCQGGNTFKKKVRIVNLASGNSPLNMATVNDDIMN